MGRLLIGVCCVVLMGCGAGVPGKEESARAGGPADLPPDLGTRKAGSDWPCFLGPTGDSVSAETGILSPWPRQGPRVIWHQKLATGYAMPTVSCGRLFVFDRL